MFGAGDLGAAAALMLARRDSLEVAVVDADGERAQALAAEVAAAAPLLGFEPDVSGGADPTLCSGSDAVVLAVGARPGEARGKDLLKRNRDAVIDACHTVMERCPDACVAIATEPLAQTCSVVAQITQFPRARLVGISGIVDSARLRALLASALRVSAQDVSALVVGGRGDEVVPLESRLTVAGIAAAELLARDRLDALIARVRELAQEPGSAGSDLAAAAAAAEVVDAICFDRGLVVPCHALLLGEYGVDGLFLAVPVRLGAHGIEEILEIELSYSERAAFERAAATARGLADELASS